MATCTDNVSGVRRRLWIALSAAVAWLVCDQSDVRSAPLARPLDRVWFSDTRSNLGGWGEVVFNRGRVHVLNAANGVMSFDLWGAGEATRLARRWERTWEAVGYGEDLVRGMAVNPRTGNLILVRRRASGGVEIPIWDEETGLPTGMLSVTGVSGGAAALNRVVVAGDGVIYASNLVGDSAASPFIVYRWDHEGAQPRRVYEGDPSGGDPNPDNRRFGDVLTVRGGGRTTELIATTRGTLVAVFSRDEAGGVTSTKLQVAGARDRWMERSAVPGLAGRLLAKSTGGAGIMPLVEVRYDVRDGEAEVYRWFARALPPGASAIGLDVDRALLGVVLAAGAGQSHAFELYHARTLLDEGDRPYLTREGNRQRGLAVDRDSGRLLLVNRSDEGGAEVPVLTPVGAGKIGELDLKGVVGGDAALNLIGVGEDGAIFASNLTGDSWGTAFRIYRWDDAFAAPNLVYEGNPSPPEVSPEDRRWGDTFAVRGSGADARLLATTRGTLAAVFTSEDGASWTPTTFAVAGAGQRQLERGVAFLSEDRFLAKSTGGEVGPGRPLLEVAFDLDAGTATVERVFSSAGGGFPFDASPLAVDEERRLLATVTRPSSASTAELLVYDLDLLSEHGGNLPVGRTLFASQNSNAAAWGAVSFHRGRVYALGTNNGLVAAALPTRTATELPRSFESWLAVGCQDDCPCASTAVGEPVADWLRHAFGVACGGDLDSAMPGIRMQGVDGLTYVFQRAKDASDVVYRVQYSHDLVEWHASQSGWGDMRIMDAGPVEVVVLSPRFEGAQRVFFRLVVEKVSQR